MREERYLELRRKEIGEQPELHWRLGVLDDALHHDLQETLVPQRDLRKMKK